MKTSIYKLLAILSLILPAAVANAQILKGTKEFQLHGAYIHINDKESASKESTALVGTQFGYFIINDLELLVDVLLVNSKADSSKSNLLYLGIGPDYFFRMGKNPDPIFRPYVGASYQFLRLNSDSDSANSSMWDLHVGTKVFPFKNSNIGIDLKYSYRKGSGVDLNVFSTGISVLF